jgi:serine-type D-Ala-D-Ala carboxypeptidase/endopeptidase (penicillin-binding protein 4)
MTMEEPTLYTCQLFIDMLRKEGLILRGRPVQGRKPNDAALLMTHDSPPMSEMIRLLLKPSDNLVAECMLKNLGAQVKGKGTADAAAEAETEWLKKIGADETAVSINDGSGLCRFDYISPKNLVTILSYMHKQKNGKMYFDALPIAGVDGTIRNRMKGTPAENNCHAKTGYISRVRTLSGYVTTKSGEPLVFSIMMNGHLCPSKSADAIQDKIVLTLANL